MQEASFLKRLAHFIAPTYLEIPSYTFFSILILVLLNLDFLLQITNTKADYRALNSHLGITFDQFVADHHIDKFLANSTTLLFWAVVGMLVYIIFWLTVNYYASIREEVATARFIFPNTAIKNISKRHWMGNNLYHSCLIVVGVIYSLFVIKFFMPAASIALKAASTHFWPYGLAYIVAALSIIGLTLHGFTLLLRFFIQRPRLLDPRT